MGKEAATPPSPLHHSAEASPDHGLIRDLNQEYEKIDDDSSSVAEIESTKEKDQELEHSIQQEMDQASIIKTIEDDCIIPSPVLKGIATVTFFGPDLNSALQLLGVKYNSMVKKNQDQVSELETLRADCETLRNKCLEECKPQYEELKQKYTRECKERKRLYNELIELKGNIRVFCRCRPLSSDEISKGCTSVLDFDPIQETELQIICTDSSRKQFKFDHIFGPMDNQETVLAETLPIVNSVLEGYNVCIFAYGQTGTGKTFTMEGDPDNRGVNYRALEELFKSSKERSSVTKYDFSVSLLEVYNEKIRDLLAENSDQAAKKLEIKQAADGTQEVPGLVESLVCSTDEVWEMLKTGSRNRSVGSTNANEQSSRSHCLVRVTIKGENLVNGQRSRSHLWLVDLAGSERVGKIEAEGERLKESQFINKSLSTLGDVISALATKNPHIPYRNSKLTRLLQSSLGGDCKTLMFAQISPSSADLGKTLCSLNFASRVRGIEYGPARKQSDPVETFKFKQMAEKLRQQEKESAKLSESLQLMNLKYTSRENAIRTLHDKVRDAEQACSNYQQKVRDAEQACSNYQQEVRELENQLAEQRKPRHQDVEQRKSRFEEGRDSAKYSHPPLTPIGTRPAFSRMSNRLPSSGTPSRGGSFVTRPGLEDRDNMSMTGKGINRAPSIPLRKARRISLSPVVCSIPVQPKRWDGRKLEILPSLPETKEYTSDSGTSESPETSDSGTSESPEYQLTDLKRRKSVTSFVSLQGTPLRAVGVAATPEYQLRDLKRRRSVPGTPLRAVGVAATPDRRDRRDKPSNFAASSNKFFSPPLLQQLWGSPRQRLRQVPSPGSSTRRMQNKQCEQPWGSPRQRLRQVPSPGSSTRQMQNKLCFSVQKRLIVNSHGFKARGGSNEALRGKEIVGSLGTAQRVLLRFGRQFCRRWLDV